MPSRCEGRKTDDCQPFSSLGAGRAAAKVKDGKVLTIINLSWRRAIIPSSWRRAIMISIPKAGRDPGSVESYRPISLTSDQSSGGAAGRGEADPRRGP